MADLIQNVQDVFKKWESRGTHSFNARGRRGSNRGQGSSYGRSGGYSDYSRPGDRRFKQPARTPFFRLPKYDGLAQFKMTPSVMTENKQRPFMGSCCSKCLPLSKASVADTRVFSLSVCNVLNIPHFQSLDFSVVLNILKKNNKPAYSDISTAVLQSEGVQNAIQDVLESCCEEGDHDEIWNLRIKSEQHCRAKFILNNLKSTISSLCLHLASVFVHSILYRIFDNVLVHKGQLELLKSASQDNVPTIFLPLHQSNLDTLLISFILFMNSIKVPLIPTDQSLYIPAFRFILKYLGVFFLRNRLKEIYTEEDLVYASVVENYVIECLKAGISMECYIDKEFSLSNPLRLDTHGLLPIIIESVLKGNIEDAQVSTISISYEKFPEENFVNEQLGQPKEKSTLWSVLCSVWRLMHSRFGSVRLNFGQPFSIKEFLQSTRQNLPSNISTTVTPPLSPTEDHCPSVKPDLEEDNFLQIKENFIKHIIFDATYSTPLMSTHLLSFLFLTQYRKGATQQQLQNSMDWIRELLLDKKRDTGFTGQSLPAIKRAAELLGKDLVSSEVIDMEWTSSDLENNNVKVTLYKPLMKLPHVLELQYYAKHVVPVFLLDSIVANAIYALVDVEICHFRHCDSQLFISRDKLIDKAIELGNLLQFEFVPIQPCSDITLCFSDILDELVEKECLHVVGVNITPGRPSRYVRKPHSLCFDASDDEDETCDTPVVKEQQLKVDLTEESISHLEFLRNILSPFIESYWLSACTLLKLIDEVKEENVFIQEMQLTAQEKLYKGLLAYEESFSAVTFKNSIKLFETWHILESYEQDGLKIVYLNENYNNKERINFTITKIEEFRK